jgi:hypothetical protein
MRKKRFPWFRVAVLGAVLVLAAAAAVFPLVFSEALVVDFLKILEVLARMS